jgi:HAD superfamily hydrolase (TIGR01484 family)
MTKFLFFDLDGTLKLRNQNISESLLTYFSKLSKDGHKTTLITGKMFHWLRACLGDSLNRCVSPNFFIGLENGSKALTLDGTMFFSEKFSEFEMSNICNFVMKRKKEISVLTFAPLEVLGKGVMYVFDKKIKDDLMKRYAPSYNFFDGDYLDFCDHFIAENPGMLAVKISDFQKDDVFLSGMDVSVNEGYLDINPKNVNKGSFVRRVMSYYGKDLQDAIVVGNDDNDRSMFELPVYKKVFVRGGAKDLSIDFPDLNFADEPDDLPRVIEGVLK